MKLTKLRKSNKITNLQNILASRSVMTDVVYTLNLYKKAKIVSIYVHYDTVCIDEYILLWYCYGKKSTLFK